jgi:hypothetical protein
MPMEVLALKFFESSSTTQYHLPSVNSKPVVLAVSVYPVSIFVAIWHSMARRVVYDTSNGRECPYGNKREQHRIVLVILGRFELVDKDGGHSCTLHDVP